MDACPDCGLPIAPSTRTCPDCGHDVRPPLADRVAVWAMLAAVGLVFVASVARVGFAVAGSLGLWVGAVFAALVVWAGIDRLRGR
ncbi:MAG: hypothetical protein R3290_00985 [Acidimicrobiia bacterium]|nr:hypothetical protein [Acidimicrobiia bacterium]